MSAAETEMQEKSVEDSTVPPAEGDTNKRPADNEENGTIKKMKLDENEKSKEEESNNRPYKKKKVAMLMVYSGKGYQGMQKNPGVHTIEDDLMDALVKAGVVTQDHASVPGQKMFIDVENPVEKINRHLPDQIRVLGFIPTTKGFDSKNATSARTYMYILPTFAFCPFDQKTTQDYKVTSEIIPQVNNILLLFKGTHNFHNFTSGKKPEDPSARRYITEFYCSEPYMQEGVEFAVIRVKGQSFMLHQIRKMIGLTIAIVKGLADKDLVEKSWGHKKYDIPKAPGLGLVLDKVHYDNYNRKFGSDGVHQPICWEKYETEIEEFKKKFIYSTIIETEKSEKSMLNWLETLHLHHFSEINHDGTLSQPTGMAEAKQKVMQLSLEKERSQEEAKTTDGTTDKNEKTSQSVTSEKLSNDKDANS